MELEILFNDEYLIAVNKPTGISSQPDSTAELSLLELTQNHLQNIGENCTIQVLHRIDKPVSGVVLFAKTEQSLATFNEMFRERKISKRYLTVVNNAPSENKGILRNYMVHNTKNNKSYITTEDKPNAKEAVLEYETLLSSEKYFLLQIKLITGRHHQIRVQLANIGCHIKGDLKYGAKRSNSNGGILLHSYLTSFTHPFTNQDIEIKAPLPSDDIWWFFKEKLQ